MVALNICLQKASNVNFVGTCARPYVDVGPSLIK